MAKTWRYDNGASDLTLGGAFTNLLADAAAGTDSITAANSGGVNSGYYALGSAVNLAGQSNTGTWTAVRNVSTAAASTQMRLYLLRVNSSGVTQAEVVSPTGYVSTATTGDKTWSWTSPALGTWASGDRLVVRVEVQNNNAHGGAVGPTCDHTATNSRLDTPFTLAVTGTKTHTSDVLVYVQGSQTHTSDVLVYTTGTKDHTTDVNVEVSGTTLTSTHTTDVDVYGWEAPRNLQVATVSNTELELTWDAVPSALGYHVERDGVQIAWTDQTTYNDTGLSPGTTYDYRVRAVR